MDYRSANPGDIVRCVNNDAVEQQLTVNRDYTVVKTISDRIEVRCDLGHLASFYGHRFEPANTFMLTAAQIAPPPAVPAQWQHGDQIEAINGYPNYFTIGRIYTVDHVDFTGQFVHVVACDHGGGSSWSVSCFKLVASANMVMAAGAGTIQLHTPMQAEATTDPEQERKDRIWRALQGAAKQ